MTWAALFTAVLICVSDRLSKIIVINYFLQGQSIKVLPNIFHITLVYNTGTAFGLMKGMNWIFIPLSCLVIFFIIVYIWKSSLKDGIISLALGLILGGATGNLIDRIKFGYVIDFFDFRIWPVFNIADSAITIGVMLLIWKLLCTQSLRSLDR